MSYFGTIKNVRDIASDAIRFFYHGNKDDDNSFVGINFYKFRMTESYNDAHRVKQEVSCILFDYEFSPRIVAYNAVVQYLKGFEPE